MLNALASLIFCFGLMMLTGCNSSNFGGTLGKKSDQKDDKETAGDDDDEADEATDADDVVDDPEMVAGSFLTCALEDPVPSDAGDGNVVVACDVMTNAGRMTDLDAHSPEWHLESVDHQEVGAEYTPSSATKHKYFVLAKSLLATSRVVLTLDGKTDDGDRIAQSLSILDPTVQKKNLRFVVTGVGPTPNDRSYLDNDIQTFVIHFDNGTVECIGGTSAVVVLPFKIEDVDNPNVGTLAGKIDCNLAEGRLETGNLDNLIDWTLVGDIDFAQVEVKNVGREGAGNFDDLADVTIMNKTAVWSNKALSLKLDDKSAGGMVISITVPLPPK